MFLERNSANTSGKLVCTRSICRVWVWILRAKNWTILIARWAKNLWHTPAYTRTQVKAISLLQVHIHSILKSFLVQVLSLFTNKFWCPRYCRSLFCNMVSSNKLQTQMLHQYLTTTLPLPTVMLGQDTTWDETMLLSNQQIQPQWPWPMGSARMRPHCKSGIKDDQDIDRTSMMSAMVCNGQARYKAAPRSQ